MPDMPLRYEISNWHELSRIKSNTSSKLYITVSDFLDESQLAGLCLRVIHADFGVLFACVLQASGGAVHGPDEGIAFELTPVQILSELEKWGFFVSYSPASHLPDAQVQYLKSLRGLHYDKLRILNVYHMLNGVQHFKWYVVAFNIQQNPGWINGGYAASKAEFVEALSQGSAINISAISRTERYNWSWLAGTVANIDDIIAANV